MQAPRPSASARDADPRAHARRWSGPRGCWARPANNGAIWVALCVVLALVDSSNREAWLICAALGPLAIALNYVVKLIVKRPRPVLEGLPPLGGAPSSLSFPSAHATSSFAVATAMTRVEPIAALAFILAAGTLPSAVPTSGMHYPSDVLAGASSASPSA